MAERVYIAIDGPIGVGKTTLARKLQPEFGAELLLEIFEENPFLSAFYADRERLAFQTQIFFLLSRYHQQRDVWRAVERQALISDYTFAKDRLFAHLNLHGDELETYERLHTALAERVVVPDLVLYLRASPEVLMERIATRDRPYERGMTASYLADVARAYEEFFASYQDGQLLALDTDRLNVAGSRADLQSVVERIRQALAGAPGEPPRPLARAVRPFGLPRQEGLAGGTQAEGLPDSASLCREYLDLQREVGGLAEALLKAGCPGPIEPAQVPALHRTLAACRAALARMSRRVSTPGGPAD